MQLDPWQKEFIEYQGDKILVAGRQTGKSEAQAYDCGEFAATHPNTTTLIISKTERQAEELLIKTLNYLQEFYPKRIGKGLKKPLKHVVWIEHGKKGHSRVMCLPTGLAGEGIKGYTIHKLSPDEGQLIPDSVYDSVSPMLLTTGGKMSITGTPLGKQGFFWKAYENKLQQFKVFHVNSEEVIKNRPISQWWQQWRKDAALAHLAREKARMSDKVYRQEYMGEFIEDLDQVFSDTLIAKVCILKRRRDVIPNKTYYMGVDVGRTTDPCTFEILDTTNKSAMEQVDNIVRKEWVLTKTANAIMQLDKEYGFKGIGVDGGGMGAGVIDILMQEKSMRKRTKDLNNAHRSVEFAKQEKTKGLLKEDMYRNLVAMMEKGVIKLLDDDELTTSLKSCQIEYVNSSKEVKIFGNDTHITEGIIRAAWLAAQDKRLNLWVR